MVFGRFFRNYEKDNSKYSFLGGVDISRIPADGALSISSILNKKTESKCRICNWVSVDVALCVSLQSHLHKHTLEFLVRQ